MEGAAKWTLSEVLCCTLPWAGRAQGGWVAAGEYRALAHLSRSIPQRVAHCELARRDFSAAAPTPAAEEDACQRSQTSGAGWAGEGHTRVADLVGDVFGVSWHASGGKESQRACSWPRQTSEKLSRRSRVAETEKNRLTNGGPGHSSPCQGHHRVGAYGLFLCPNLSLPPPSYPTRGA